MKKRPTSAVGYKRPISQYARVAMAMGSHPRYRVSERELVRARGTRGCLINGMDKWDGWLDGRKEGWVDGWMDGRKEGWVLE